MIVIPGKLMALAFALQIGGCGSGGPASTNASPAPQLAPGSAGGPTVAAAPPARDRVAIGPDAEGTDVSSIIGKQAPGWELTTWINGPPLRVDDLRGQVVLVRWFMSAECRYCNATAPSLVDFHQTYANRGLTVVGMYHHKGEAPLEVAEVQSLVSDHYRFRFPVAIDHDWKTLRRWWLDAHPDGWTSLSFLVDRQGVVRFVHTGGEYPPGSDDQRQMKAWIEQLLAEPAGR